MPVLLAMAYAADKGKIWQCFAIEEDRISRTQVVPGDGDVLRFATIAAIVWKAAFRFRYSYMS